MTIFKLENNGTAKDILVNGQLIAKATEDGLQATKPAKGPASVDDDDYVRQDQVFGVGQTLQDVTTSRATSTLYVNTTGKPIAVYVRGTTSAANGLMNLYIGSGDLAAATGARPDTAGAVGVNAVIPPGERYRVETLAVTILLWMEYRP